MKIAPITPVINPSHRNYRWGRASMSLRKDDHTVTDMLTGERFELPMEEAWELHKRLNTVC